MRLSLLFRLPLLSLGIALSIGLVLIVFVADTPHAGKPSSKKKPSQDPLPSSPLSLEYESYSFRFPSGDHSCLGEDDYLRWRASGMLEPGQSFSFTPQYPGCQYHSSAITIALSWQGSELELAATVPDNDLASWDLDQQGTLIAAPNVGSSAQLCMFPYYRSSDRHYTITVTNVGGAIADSILLDGRSDNDWSVNFYKRCLNADADHDGWNDSLEHSMSTLLYPVSDITLNPPYDLWGSNYMDAAPDTNWIDDEVDATVADLNDDGVVNELDVDRINQYLDQGNGIPLEQISPNPNEPEYVWANAQAWRRYDLNADGYVTRTDTAIVEQLLGQPVPMATDWIAPTARLLIPDNSSVPKGEFYKIRGHVWDNAGISRVEYLVDGQLQCVATEPDPDVGQTSPFYACWWQVPKRPKQYQLSIRVYDAAGNITTSDSISVNAN